MLRVYICSPYRGDTAANTATARAYCRMAFDCGYDPVAPHLYYPQFTDDNKSNERNRCMRLAKRLLAGCNEIWVIGDAVTDGMRGELALAKMLGIPIRTIDDPLPDKPLPEADRATPQAACKHRCGEYGNVLLTNAQLDKLKAKFPNDWQRRIDALSGYKKSKGVAYDDDYATILNWARRDEEKNSQSAAKHKRSHFMDYDQRKYSDDELNRIGVKLLDD